MRTACLGALFVIALAACWDPSKHPQKDGGVTGNGGAGSCSTCGDVVLAGAASTSLCTPSGALFESLQTCACDQGPCGATCYNSLCMGGAADGDCKTCMLSKCASSFANCSNDASH